jgi:hypothetical protein
MRCSTTTPLRFRLLTAAVLWLATTAAALAQDDITIALKLSAEQVAEIVRLADLQPINKSQPDAFWQLQIKIAEALQANPDAMRAVLQARSAKR